MVKNYDLTSETSAYVAYDAIRMMAKVYKDNMSVEQKYKELSKTANTKSMGEDFFLIAGKVAGDGRYFEKDIKKDDYWLYLRVEFPQPLALYIDTLLQYVKNYEPTIIGKNE